MKKLISTAEGFVRLTHNVAALLLALAAVLVFYQVITRFVLNDAAAWSEILARAVIIWTVFLVAGAAFRQGKMIPIEIIRSVFPHRARIWIARAVSLATLIFLGVLAWYGYKMTLRVLHQQVAMIDVSVAWLYASLPIGAVLAVPGVLLALRDEEAGHRSGQEGAE